MFLLIYVMLTVYVLIRHSIKSIFDFLKTMLCKSPSRSTTLSSCCQWSNVSTLFINFIKKILDKYFNTGLSVYKCTDTVYWFIFYYFIFCKNTCVITDLHVIDVQVKNLNVVIYVWWVWQKAKVLQCMWNVVNMMYEYTKVVHSVSHQQIIFVLC